MVMSSEDTPCQSCGQPISAGRVGGFCPACLWRGLFVDTLANPPTGGAASFASLRLPGLTVVDEIARGGMGIVYRAHQQEPDRDVALKMLLPWQVAAPTAKERFRAEARAIAALDHPGILPVHEVGELDGLPWFTMKLAAGGSLAQRRKQFAGRWRAIAELVAQLSDAIQFAHERGILHRDLKPGNILFDDAGHAYVSDFGLAKFLDTEAALTESRAMLGTPSYLAPELLEPATANATTAVDIYGLGALLYELLTGRPPLEAATMAVLLKQISGKIPERPRTLDRAVPANLEIICLKCLEKDPARRYASARDLSADLQRWLADRPILARPASLPEVLSAWVRRNPVVATLAALLTTALVGGGVALFRQNNSLAQALQRSEAAQKAERASRRISFVAQAGALGQTDQAGRQAAVLEAVKRATAIPDQVSRKKMLGELRDEAIAALARPDLTLERRWWLPLPANDAFCFVAFSPSLDRYAVTHGETVEILGTTNQNLIARLPVKVDGAPNNLGFSPDGRMLAVLQPGGDASVWDLAATNRMFALSIADGPVAHIEFHPAGKTLAVVRQGKSVELLHPAGQRFAEWPITNGLATRFSPDGNRLAIVTERGVEVWSIQPAQLLWRAPVAAPVHHADWHPAGTALLVASRREAAVFVLDAATGVALTRHSAHIKGPARFEFHPAGRLVASMGREGVLHLWDARTGRDLVMLEGTVGALHFSPDGGRLGYSPTLQELGVLTLTPDRAQQEFPGEKPSEATPEDLLVSPDGRELITVSSQGLHRWDASSGRQLESIQVAGDNRMVAAMSPDGQQLFYSRRGNNGYQRNRTNAVAEALPIVAGGAVLGVDSAGDWLVARGDHSLAVWRSGDAANSRIIGRNLGGMHHAFSADGRWIAISHRVAGVIRVVDARHRSGLKDLAGGVEGLVPRAWFTPDSSQLLTSNGRLFQLWKTGSWRELRSWPVTPGTKVIGMAAISADGRYAALEEAPDVFQLVDLRTGERIARLRPPSPQRAAAAVFAPDGHSLWIAGTGPRIFRWDLDFLKRELSPLGLAW